MTAGDQFAYANNRQAFSKANGASDSTSSIPGLGLGGGLLSSVVAADRERDGSRSPYFTGSAPLSRNPSSTTNGHSRRPSSEEDVTASSDLSRKRRGDDSPRPKKRLIRGGDIDRDVAESSAAGSEVTSPIDDPEDMDADGSMDDDELPDVDAAIASKKPKLTASGSTDDVPSSSMNSRLGKLKVAESRGNSRGASPLASSAMIIDDDDGPAAGNESQMVGVKKAKGKARVLDDDEEDDVVEMAPPPPPRRDSTGPPKGGAVTDASSPPVVAKPIRKRPVIPDSPDVSFSKPAPAMSGHDFLNSLMQPPRPPAIPISSSPPLSPNRSQSPPKTPGGSIDKEAHFRRLAGIYQDKDPREVRRVWDRCGGDVRRFTSMMHTAQSGSQPRKPAQLVRGGLAQGSVVPKKASPEIQEISAPPRKLKKKVEVYSDDEYGSSDEEEEPAVTEAEALKFFNECDEADMPGATACTIEQARIVISLRPFADADDFKKKLRKKKGVSSAILEQYRDIMKVRLIRSGRLQDTS